MDLAFTMSDFLPYFDALVVTLLGKVLSVHQLGAHPCTCILALYNGLTRQALRTEPDFAPQKSLAFLCFRGPAWRKTSFCFGIIVRGVGPCQARSCYFLFCQSEEAVAWRLVSARP